MRIYKGYYKTKSNLDTACSPCCHLVGDTEYLSLYHQTEGQLLASSCLNILALKCKEKFFICKIF